jgi:hypothetical protein
LILTLHSRNIISLAQAWKPNDNPLTSIPCLNIYEIDLPDALATK